MTNNSTPTAYARLSTREARLALAAMGICGVFLVAVTFSPLANRGVAEMEALGPDAGDVALYRAEVERIRAGEGYYAAAADELRTRGYPTGSVFNWRTPLPMWLLGKLPAAAFGKAILCGLSLAVMLLAFEALAREERNVIRRPVACALLLTGPLLPCLLGDLYVMPSLWAGVLMAVSLCAYGVNRPSVGVAAGLAAVFFRELALPYCLLAATIAIWNRRRGELLAWSVGLGAYFAFFAIHWHTVVGIITPADRLHHESWIQFGAAAFVIATTQMTAYLLLLPQWITALYLTAALFGLAGWNTPLGHRVGLTVCGYVVAFAVIGQPFNQYWGSLLAPLLCFGVVRLPASVRDACSAANVAVPATAQRAASV